MTYEPNRPRIAAEVRAWILATVSLGSVGLAMVWWAATLTVEVRALKEVMLRDYVVLREEQRALRLDLDQVRKDVQKLLGSVENSNATRR